MSCFRGFYSFWSKIRDRKLKEAAHEHGVTITKLIDHTLADLADFQQTSGRSDPYKVYTPFYKKLNTYLQTFHQPSSPITSNDLQTVDLQVMEGGPDLLGLF
ncbi:deoxyribodipyrimidine photo-lyase [Paenibacillus sp. N3.4]|uniref:deoxyribodipyrimidine photo-lyase n=1 Tax=Paenibacillus sp. N3.4 TaxID=2603222 RepID=UPI0011C9E2E0|nr:deoxyribodipyrimidine photo-lyase [Paenibacillus sp. N3.4]TXK74093.1 deoxyribodipyrimidine photo-lyase [Paenibacillus sp. N3.4]